MSTTYSGPFDRKINAVVAIANAVSGTEEGKGTGDRMADALERISENVFGKIAGVEESTATDVAGLKADLNGLIAAMKNAGVMEMNQFSVSAQKITDSVAGHADRQYNSNKVYSIGVDWADDKKSAEIIVTLSAKVADLKDFDGGNGWGVHKWLGIGIGVGVSPITRLKYNGEYLTQADIDEAALCGMDSGAKFVRWIAADLVLAGDNTQNSKDTFTLWANGYEEVSYKLKIIERP